MDIFKLFFDHDLRLDRLKERNTGNEPKTEMSIEDFMKPIPTYSKFYLTGTLLEDEKFGLNILTKYGLILDRLSEVFKDQSYKTGSGYSNELENVLETADIGDAILMAPSDDIPFNPRELKITDDSNVGHIKEQLREVLLEDIMVIYKEKAHHGFDLHLFSKKNIYTELFKSFQQLLDDSFRFFSINNKRIDSERKFYFETWTLDKPPHGVEEVFTDTVL